MARKPILVTGEIMPENLTPLVQCLDGRTRHVTLTHAKRLGIGKKEWAVGIDLIEVYLQPRAKMVVLHTFSRWENPGHLGRAVGDSWHEADNLMIAKLAKEFEQEDGELLALLPQYVANGEHEGEIKNGD